MSKKAKYAICPGCNQRRALTPEGVFRLHGRCGGSSLYPWQSRSEWGEIIIAPDARPLLQLEIVRLHAKGLAFCEIGDLLGISRSYAHELHARANGKFKVRKKVPRPPKPPPLSHYRRIAAAVHLVAKRELNKRHGTEYRYSLGCRCDHCTLAIRDKKRRQRQLSGWTYLGDLKPATKTVAE